MRTRYGKLCERHSSGDGAADETLLSTRDQWILANFSFLKAHIVRCPTRKSQALVRPPDPPVPVPEQQVSEVSLSSSDTARTTPTPTSENGLRDSDVYRQLEKVVRTKSNKHHT